MNLKYILTKVMPPKKKTRSVARTTTTSAGAGAGAVTATATSVTAVRNLKSNLKGPEVPPKNKAIGRTKENSATGGDATGGSSECCVCSNHIADGKNDALFCEGVYMQWVDAQILCWGPTKTFREALFDVFSVSPVLSRHMNERQRS